jgi:hypothetical protein
MQHPKKIKVSLRRNEFWMKKQQKKDLGFVTFEMKTTTKKV